MAQPTTAGPPGSERPSSLPAEPRVHQDTARISIASVHGGRELPGWFWGALGCFSVLVVGLSVLFFVVRPGAAATVPPGSPAVSANAPAGAARIQVEPIASPPSPALQPLSAGKPRPPRGVKIAHSPSPSARRSPDSPAAAGDDDKAAEAAADDTAKQEEELLRPRKTDATEEELLRPRKPTAAASRVNRERAAPAGDDDDSTQEN